ncbi:MULTISPECIES: TetR/AcrR family transcriptional regulator [Curtobacterium]|uniref:TetR/AcrR family transcriptional regulator n=1 Tax=Curtobacterium TaxID=2034 RepID=UPI00217E2145|nr:TetR/AcrR family transcriptional regulator [Curtobacterium flaccumfaciens]MCS6561254.1 TetR/AcrR family transcriptional regulator [Curtobacterium flaccumfaciens pv. poinsettiae]
MTDRSDGPTQAPDRPRAPRGRPRATGERRAGRTTRAEILDAAAELFATQGYLETTTRQIADRVGIKQASLYYHFAEKHDIVLELLARSTSPAVAFADWLDRQEIDPVTRLAALSSFDTSVVLSTPDDIVAVFRMPGVARALRDDDAGAASLRDRYQRLAAEVLAHLGSTRTPSEQDDVDLVFGLVESVVSQRYWGRPEEREAYATAVTRGCLRLLRVPEDAIGRSVSAAAEIVARYGGDTAPGPFPVAGQHAPATA